MRYKANKVDWWIKLIVELSQPMSKVDFEFYENSMKICSFSVFLEFNDFHVLDTFMTNMIAHESLAFQVSKSGCNNSVGQNSFEIFQFQDG